MKQKQGGQSVRKVTLELAVAVAGYRSVPSPRAAHPKNGLSAVQRWGRSFWLVRLCSPQLRNRQRDSLSRQRSRGDPARSSFMRSQMRRQSRAYRVGLDLRRRRSIVGSRSSDTRDTFREDHVPRSSAPDQIGDFQSNRRFWKNRWIFDFTAANVGCGSSSWRD